MTIDRRTLLKCGLGSTTAALMLDELLSLSAEASVNDDIYARAYPKEWSPFSEDMLLEKARALSRSPYVPTKEIEHDGLKGLDYDQYRSIRYNKDLGIWKKDKLDFAVEMFHAGYIYHAPIQLFLVEGNRTGEFKYDSGLFSFGPKISGAALQAQAGFSGFRIHAPVNRADVQDEFVVFQGASYFRSKAGGQDYGISARGLALNTAQPPADEFPAFRAFWIKKPEPGEKIFIVYALLDSVSVSGLYKFVISNRYNTIMDVDCTLFPRQQLPYPGIAPLTSMFFFAPSNRLRVDEVRPRVHDSDGLSIVNGKGEHIWRPLINATRIEFSVFQDKGMKGFGLIQRERRPDRYEDFDARYDLRPSLWVEPDGDWGEGSVDLVELPTQNEYFDNIVAFWRPKEALEGRKSYSFKYKLTWGSEAPIQKNIAVVSQTLVGASTQREGLRLYYIDFVGTEAFELCDEDEEKCADKMKNVELTASAGSIINVAFRKNKISGGHRLGFEYAPAQGVIEADIRCSLISHGKAVSEVWIYRWTA